MHHREAGKNERKENVRGEVRGEQGPRGRGGVQTDKRKEPRFQAIEKHRSSGTEIYHVKHYGVKKPQTSLAHVELLTFCVAALESYSGYGAQRKWPNGDLNFRPYGSEERQNPART